MASATGVDVGEYRWWYCLSGLTDGEESSSTLGFVIESVSTMGGSIEVVGWKEGDSGRVDVADVNDEAESEEGTEPSNGH
jgi:hypothetical protein